MIFGPMLWKKKGGEKGKKDSEREKRDYKEGEMVHIPAGRLSRVVTLYSFLRLPFFFY